MTVTRGGVDDLLTLADTLNAELELSSGRGVRSELGQFTTPSEAARTMAELVDFGPALKVVDPGAGAGALMLALVASSIKSGAVEELSVDLVETDPRALALLEAATKAAHLAAEACGVKLTTRIVDQNFCDGYGWEGGSQCDAVIVNPPYMKLGSSDPCRIVVAERHGVDCPNLYAAFLTTAMERLRPGGQLVAITPRSFANGLYFSDFRRYLTDKASFGHVVLFDRRDRVFGSSSVLQETLIFSMHKSAPELGSCVRVETRLDHISEPLEIHEVPHCNVVQPDDPDRCINLPSSPDVLRAAEQISALPTDLQSLGLTVSTGPIVDFRCRDYLTAAQTAGSVPLIYPANLRQDRVQWPIEARKPQGFVASPQTRRWLFPNGFYVVVKRFTAKEEKRRVVACVHDPVDGYDQVTFENHVNVIHRDHGPLQRSEAESLADFLNSDLVDTYFRMFSGSTQVNATDLRRLRFPQVCESRRPQLFDVDGRGSSLQGHRTG